jgi:2-polyprenyl-3-methyl-5-hydroxy-6-metoxy-1,4-benzoquinol methylase
MNSGSLQSRTLPECWCGNSNYALIYRGTSHRNVPNYSFSLHRCRDCSTVRTQPVPQTDLYSHGDVATQDRLTRENLYRGFADQILDKVSRFSSSGRFLDIGCNTGVVVEVAAQRGFDAWGIDLDPTAIAHGAKLGRQLKCGNLLEDRFSEGHFDIVLLNHVLEHVPSLVKFIKAVRSQMRPGSLLFVNVPNYAGIIPSFMKANWGALWPHQHVWQFSPVTLTRVFEHSRAFEVIEVNTSHNLEPPSSNDWKGAAKQTLISLSQFLKLADEIQMVLRAV